MARFEFPKGFVWGSATASYQIEGAVAEDGRGESIWDRFCQSPGNILNGDVGDVACDHYHRYREDVALMKQLRHNGYRFSIAWPRVMPAGRGEVNAKGLDFYSRLVDELLEANIEPFVTLYHWDLPQKLQDVGGWTNPEMPDYFADYCRVIYEHLHDRVHRWITLNEPFVSAFVGYFIGRHAPGYRDMSSALAASYNLLAGHGRSVSLFRESGYEGEIGITLNLLPRHPLSDRAEDHEAARIQDGYANRWFLDPLFRGEFPADMLALYRKRGLTLPEIKQEELVSMKQKLDFLGLNYYNVGYVRHDPRSWPLHAEEVVPDMPATGRGWPIVPQGLTEMLQRLTKEYRVGSIYITENGAAYNDVVDTHGAVDDYARIDYLRRHLVAAHKAIEAGVNLKGYFVWTLYDNFEWGFGHYSRFGIVYNDFATQKRTIKRSGYWLREVIAANAVED